jgi:hypothetical protein
MRRHRFLTTKPRSIRPRWTVLLVASSLVVAGSLLVAGIHGASAGRPGASGSAVSTKAQKAAAAYRSLPKRNILASSDNLPADCIPNPAGPPTAPYQLGLVGTVQGGVLNAGPATVSNINVTFCGVVTLTNGTQPCGATGTVVSPPDGQVFGPLSVALTLVPGMSPSIGFTANPATITGGFTCTTSSANGLDVFLNATVSGTTSELFGVSCTIGPLTIPLSGVITGPLTKLTGTLTGNSFTVPAITPSPTCPGSVPANIDAIAGLPIAPGGANASLPVSASLYQPAG